MQYKIESITWSGLWWFVGSNQQFSAGYFKFTFHDREYLFNVPHQINVGDYFFAYSDRVVMRRNSAPISTNYYLVSTPSGATITNLGTRTDASSAQYSTAVLHDLSVANKQLTGIALKLEANAAGELSFTVPAVNPVHDSHESDLVPMGSLIVVYEGEDILWQGRLTSKTESLDGSIECSAEGLLACMNDGYVGVYDDSSGLGINPQTLVEYYTAQHYFAVSYDLEGWVVGQPLPAHEKRVYPFKRWYSRGNLNELNDFGYVYRSDTEYSNMATLLKEAILDPLGGFFYLTYPDTAESQPPALNYTVDISNIGTTKKVKFAVNLQDFKVEKDCSDYFTHLMPLGKLEEGVESYEGGLSDGRFRLGWDGQWTHPNVDAHSCISIARILGYSAIPQVNKAGLIVRAVQFDDCTTQDGLYRAAVNYIKALNFDWTYSIDAVDMELIDSSQQSEPIHIGDTLQIFLPGNQSTTPDFSAVVLGINLDISEPWNSSYTIGNLNNKQVTRGLV